MSVNLRQILRNGNDQAPIVSPDLKAKIAELVVSYDRFVEHWGGYGLRPFTFITFGSLVSDPIGFSDSDRLPQLTGPFFETYAAELRTILERAADILQGIDPAADPNIYSLEGVLG